MRSILKVTGRPVEDHKGRRVGRVAEVLFAPGSKRVVGYQVSRSRLLMILDRKDRFLAHDRASLGEDGFVVPDPKRAWDKSAEKDLGILWDETVVWLGMPVRTVGGESLGKVRDALFDPRTGELDALGLTGGVTADVALGFRDLPASMVEGYADGAIVVTDEAVRQDTTGGAAAAAGRGAAQAKQAARTAAAYGKSAVRVAAGSKTGRKAAGWLKALKDEVVDMMGDPDDE